MRVLLAQARALRQLLALALAVSVALGASAFSDGEALSRWMSVYYQAPEPQRLREAVSQFVAEPIRLDRPERLDAPAHFFAVVASSNAQARKDLATLAATMPTGAGKQFVERVLGQSGQLPFTRARDPNDLDVAWAHFAATGNVDAARIVVAALDFQEQDVDVTRAIWKAIKVSDRSEAARLMRSAAAWSLSKHAQAHPRVKDLLEKELAGARSEPQRAQLRGILDGKISLK
jgi:hypothetical protein